MLRLRGHRDGVEDVSFRAKAHACRYAAQLRAAASEPYAAMATFDNQEEADRFHKALGSLYLEMRKRSQKLVEDE